MSERLTSEQYRAKTAPSKRSKYGNRKVTIDGITFDSVAEGKRWSELRQLENAGVISHLERQPRFNLKSGDRPVVYASGRQAFYKADFAYFDGDKRVVEDVKGFSTPEYKLKRAIVEAMHPAVKIVEIRK
jgi:hypothetical protein